MNKRDHLPCEQRFHHGEHDDGQEIGMHTHFDGETHSHAHTHTHQNTKAVMNRLSRAIGHLTAVRGMVERGEDCSDVLVQLAAVRSAINGICEVILQDHIDNCIVDAVKTGDMDAVEELNHAIRQLLKK